MKIKKIVFGILFAAAALVSGSALVSADERESGETEPRGFCESYPWLCDIATTQGNGSGNEPPQ